jgi:hypothetical protein
VIRLFLLLAIVFLAACSSPADSDPALAPVFVVMCADIDPGEPPHPCCTGFAMGGQVVTANHCVPDEYARIVSRQQWLHTASDSEIGHVVARDTARDIAWLDAPVDEQLTRGAPIGLDASVSVLTVSGVKYGTAFGRYGILWRTNADTMLGDSGAAVVDIGGRAIGVLSNCLIMMGHECDPHTGMFAELP